MSKYPFIILAALLTTAFSFATASAKFALPDYVHTLSQLAEAQKQAQQSSRPLAFVCTNKESACTLTTAASEDVFAGLKDHSVLVYVELNSVDSLPALVAKALNSAAAGQQLPKTAVISSDLRTLIDLLPDVEESLLRAARIRETQEKIAHYMQEQQ
ncbi:hypothetical protein GCAAIG_01760 [Candidatus Electronema halotolerans]